MLQTKIYLIIILLLFGTSVFPTALTTINIATTDSCDIPTWYMGDEWIYTADPVSYYSDNGSFNGKIENLKREVVGITTITHGDEQFEVYEINITGDISGELTWEMISGDLEGEVEGFSYVRVSDLAEVKTEIVSAGTIEILFITQDYELINSNLFFPPLELYDFPLKLYDQWEISSNIVTSGSFIIEGLVEEEYSESDMFNVAVQCNDNEIVSVPAGDFESFKITYSSVKFWYSPEVGNIVKSEVEQSARDYTFNMDLSLESFSRGIQPITVTENIVPSEAFIDQEVIISGQAIDLNSDPIQNGDISIEIPRIGESWSTLTDDDGYYTIQIAAPYIFDDTPSEGEFGSDGVIVCCLSDDMEGFCVKTLLILDDLPPNIPIIDGPVSGKIGEEHEYTFSTTDPDGDDVYYWVGWGDGQTDEWIGPYESGEEVLLSHTWDEEGTFYIRVKARDGYDVESDWATLEVEMPVNQHSYSFPLLQRLLERFPNAFPILRHLLAL